MRQIIPGKLLTGVFPNDRRLSGLAAVQWCACTGRGVDKNTRPADVGESVLVVILNGSFKFFGCGVWVRIGLRGHRVAVCGLGHGSLLTDAM